MNRPGLGWLGIVRLGLVQAALGSIVVLVTSVMNRVMTIELALPALVPGALIALHYALQLLRPKFGHGSDMGGRRTPWMVGGMALLGSGAVLAACAIALASDSRWPGLVLAIIAFTMIGLGVGACGTALLTLLADRCDASRRPIAATVVWLMMIAGFVLTTVVAGHFLDPFSFSKLIFIATLVASIGLAVTLLATWRLEPKDEDAAALPERDATASFAASFRDVWKERHVRCFTVFIFISMLAYSSEELILDPFSAFVFGYTPGQSTQLSGALHAGVFCGMLLVALVATLPARRKLLSLQAWMIAGCVASALSLSGLGALALHLISLPLRPLVTALGLSNGIFAVAAIGSMMQLANLGAQGRQGTRMGLWGAAQGVAFGLGGVLASGTSDLARIVIGSPASSYALVFALEALLFAVAAHHARRLHAQHFSVLDRVHARHLALISLEVDA